MNRMDDNAYVREVCQMLGWTLIDRNLSSQIRLLWFDGIPIERAAARLRGDEVQELIRVLRLVTPTLPAEMQRTVFKVLDRYPAEEVNPCPK